MGFVAKYAKSSKTLKVTGSGFAGVCTFEINGATDPKAAVLNRTGTIAKVKGKASFLGLQKGPNRVRVYCNALHSNILILNM